MDDTHRAFLDSLLDAASPSGFELPAQRVWVEYVSQFADEVTTDAYGNAIAVYEGGDPKLALTGHADEIGFIVRTITDDGYVMLDRIGGADKTVSRGQHIMVHAGDGPVPGVVGQAAIHLRDPEDEKISDITEQHVDIGASDREEAEELVEIGDAVTFSTTRQDLHGTRLAARGMDNRIGIWAAAEGLRRAVEADVDATVYAVSTVMEEIGLQGAKMIAHDLNPDVAIAVDVTHATDSPDAPSNKGGDISLGEGPVVARGSANHPTVVDLARQAAEKAEIDVQLQAAGSFTGTDADAFFTTRGGIPSLNIGLPNRYMHTPVEVIDTEDLSAMADLLCAIADHASEYGEFSVSL
ncbi:MULTISPECIES: M20/M25/M40 family metallo-hydrolase [unclassified Haladaptatus]|uniref:M20/M25/M40 family metallo-hydrolase n=1 Tax=unclassified Haladaptatus TaxID=2622732 RepID=UPI0023E7BEB1|nr:MULTISPECIES: M20/M25/M40 family metallo-hydrolase [unclassified Haladaptatus]